MKLKSNILLLLVSLIIFFVTLFNYSWFLEIIRHEPYTDMEQQFYEALILATILAVLPWIIFIFWNRNKKHL